MCKTVNLRQCHVILMLDNLVRLTYKRDPNPGECRSNQLCTLPITLQGLPIDSYITDQWHTSECDGTNACVCKKPVQLKKDDIEPVLLKLQPTEEDALRRFESLMTWGTSFIWKRLNGQLNLEKQMFSLINNVCVCFNYDKGNLTKVFMIFTAAVMSIVINVYIGIQKSFTYSI